MEFGLLRRVGDQTRKDASGANNVRNNAIFVFWYTLETQITPNIVSGMRLGKFQTRFSAQKCVLNASFSAFECG